jgi:hypothetical protein
MADDVAPRGYDLEVVPDSLVSIASPRRRAAVSSAGRKGGATDSGRCADSR